LLPERQPIRGKSIPINVPPVPRYWKKAKAEKWKIFHVLQVMGAGNLS
jgi:hypothetical protein